MAAAPVTQLRRWLKETPQPSALRLDENEKKVIRIARSQARCWSDAEKSVLALDATIVEALDHQGNVIRAFRLKDDDAEKEPPKPQQEAWPEHEQAQLAVIITAACDRAASRHEAAYRMSFDKLASMYEAQTLRLEEALARAATAEARLERERRQWMEAVNRSAGQSGDEETGLGQLVGGLLGPIIEREVNRHMVDGEPPNGKGDH